MVIFSSYYMLPEIDVEYADCRNQDPVVEVPEHDITHRSYQLKMWTMETTAANDQAGKPVRDQRTEGK